MTGGHHQRRWRAVLVAACVLAVLAPALAEPGLALALAPAFLLLAALAFGHFPGEQLIERLAVARRALRRRRPCSLAARRRPERSYSRVGRLLAFALAVRPPPAPALG
jgi:hypothetical protein